MTLLLAMATATTLKRSEGWPTLPARPWPRRRTDFQKYQMLKLQIIVCTELITCCALKKGWTATEEGEEAPIVLSISSFSLSFREAEEAEEDEAWLIAAASIDDEGGSVGGGGDGGDFFSSGGGEEVLEDRREVVWAISSWTESLEASAIVLPGLDRGLEGRQEGRRRQRRRLRLRRRRLLPRSDGGRPKQPGQPGGGGDGGRGGRREDARGGDAPGRRRASRTDRCRRHHRRGPVSSSSPSSQRQRRRRLEVVALVLAALGAPVLEPDLR